MTRTTRTYAILEVPPEFFKFAKEKLEDAGYNHAIIDLENETHLDMHGIALAKGKTNPLKDEPKTDVVELIERLLDFTGTKPNDDRWIKTIRKTAIFLGWPICSGCEGTPPTDANFPENCCNVCYNVGYEQPDD